MSTPPDQFTQNFDAIEIDRAPSPSAIGRALAACSHDRPGYYLEEDADGRFVVDREFGVISLSDEALLSTEFGRAHEVRLCVVESTGDSYALNLKLHITGVVPLMAGSDAFGSDGEIGAPPPRPASPVPWITFSPARGRQTAPPLATDGAFGSILSAPLPLTDERVVIAFSARVPAPSKAHAAWLV